MLPTDSRVSVRRRLLELAGWCAATAALPAQAWAQVAGKASGGRRLPEGLAGFKGQIVTRRDPRYLGWFWAMSWYRVKPDRYPALFAQPVDRADLALLMKYAARARLRVVPRSSGHNITAAVLAQDAITVDMSRFDKIESLDTQQQSVWAGPGVTSQPLNELLYAHGYAFPSAHTGFVTIGGFLLGGGMGWNMPQWGMGCGSVLAAEVMLADGSVVTASESEHPELYWAIRGVGPGFFGIVMRYKLRIHRCPVIVKNTYFYTVDKVEAAVAEFVKLLPQSANRTEVLGAMGLFNPPGTPSGQEKWHWAVNLMSYGATPADAQEAARVFTQSAALKELAAATILQNTPLTYLDLYTQLSTDAYSEFRTTEIALFTDEPAKALSTLGRMLSERAVDARSFGFCVLGTNPTVPEPSCFTYAAPHYLSWYLIGTSNADVARNGALADDLRRALDPYARGYYMNEIDLGRYPELAQKCFAPDKWRKLLAVRKRYDPEHRFVSYLDDAG